MGSPLDMFTAAFMSNRAQWFPASANVHRCFLRQLKETASASTPGSPRRTTEKVKRG